MSNLREALSEQWGQPPDRPADAQADCCSTCSPWSASGSRWSARSRSPAWRPGSPHDLLDLVGLGRPGLGAGPAGVLGRAARPRRQLADLPVGDRPPAAPARHAAQRGQGRACSAPSGFEVLKQVMTFYLTSVTARRAGRSSARSSACWCSSFFASRFILFVTAWAATAKENEQEEPGRRARPGGDPLGGHGAVRADGPGRRRARRGRGARGPARRCACSPARRRS